MPEGKRLWKPSQRIGRMIGLMLTWDVFLAADQEIYSASFGREVISSSENDAPIRMNKAMFGCCRRDLEES